MIEKIYHDLAKKDIRYLKKITGQVGFKESG
jgi:hypothetical protein